MQTGTIQTSHDNPLRGKGTITIRIQNQKVQLVELEANRTQRFFESAGVGMPIQDLIRLSSRIDQSQSTFHAIAVTQAIEHAGQVTISPQTKWFREQALQLALGYHHAQRLLLSHIPQQLNMVSIRDAEGSQRFWRENSTLIYHTFAQSLDQWVGGPIENKAIHLGGYYQTPSLESVHPLIEQLESIREPIMELMEKWNTETKTVSTKPIFVAHANSNYLLNSGTIQTSDGQTIKSDEYDSFYHRKRHEWAIQQGARARMVLNRRELNAKTYNDCAFIFKKNEATHLDLGLLQLIELAQVVDHLTTELKNGKFSREEVKTIQPTQEKMGESVIESATGILSHQVQVSAQGKIKHWQIQTPLNQQSWGIEQEIRKLVEDHIHEEKKEIEKKIQAFVQAQDLNWLELLHNDESFFLK